MEVVEHTPSKIILRDTINHIHGLVTLLLGWLDGTLLDKLRSHHRYGNKSNHPTPIIAQKNSICQQ